MKLSALQHSGARSNTLPGFLTALGRYTVLKPFFKKLPQRVFVGGPSPSRIVADTSPLLAGDPAIADAFYRGEVTLAGHTVRTGTQSLFASAPTRTWLLELVGFDWLRHHAAAANPVANAQAQAIVSEWIDVQGHWHDIAWKPVVVARRLSAWICNAEMLYRQAPEPFQDKLVDSMGRQLRYLLWSADSVSQPVDRLMVRTAIVQAVICLDGCQKYRSRAVESLSAELETQILADGSHRSRNPEVLIRLLGVLIPLRRTFETCALELPHALLCAIERMIPMLRLLCHSDGGLALFNGVRTIMKDRVAGILETDSTQGRPLTHGRHSGYHRMVHDKTTVIADMGRPARGPYGPDAHAGCLSFELSHGHHRIVVNCGAASDDDLEWHHVACTTAAHSTATLNDRSSGRIRKWRGFGLFRQRVAGPTLCESERRDGPAGAIVEAWHNGYESRFGLTHARRLFLDHDGGDLRGEDRFNQSLASGAPARTDNEYCIRFHLHPAVRATRAKDGNTILLSLPNHVGWRFNASGARISLEDSIYLADSDTPRRSRQIVIHGHVNDAPVVKWAFKKMSKVTSPPNQPADQALQLPLQGGSDG